MGCGVSSITYHPVTIKDFKILTAIGKGTFCKVCIVERKTTRKLYACKFIHKEKAIVNRSINHLIQERKFLEELRHPFITSLCYSFQDSSYFYLLLDLFGGGDLRFHAKVRNFNQLEMQSILAEIASALKYLHTRQIVHRDIKPDNILLDNQGHAYLTDFNVATRIMDGKPLKSVAGTEPYLAPEVLLVCGYDYAVDWWSLGVTTYEVMIGERPFRTKMRRDLIKRCKYRYPSDFPEIPKNFISGLLTQDPSARLGYEEQGFDKLQKNEFFQGFNWELVNSKGTIPAFVPKYSNNFTRVDTTGELPLSYKISLPIFHEFDYYDYTQVDVIRAAGSSYALPLYTQDTEENRVMMDWDQTTTRYSNLLTPHPNDINEKEDVNVLEPIKEEKGNTELPALPPLPIK